MLSLGCQQRPPAAEEQAPPPTTPETDSRGYDPLELPEDREIVPEAHPRSGHISGQTAFVEVADMEADTVAAIAQLPPDAVDSLSNQAFRVQLFTSKAYGEARHAVNVAEEIFDRPVYLDYEVPYFKVRVGSFADREGAEEYMMRAKTAGYDNAWVVAVNVRVKETPSLYDESFVPVLPDSVNLPDEEFESDE